jgi:small conductance mechanosensitive channel
MNFDLSTFFNFEDIIAKIIGYIPGIIAAAIVFFVFKFLYKFSAPILKAVAKKAKLEPYVTHLLIDNIYYFTLMIIGVVMAISQLGVDVGAALAGIGVAGVAVGFAAQDVLSSVIAGFMIFLDKPFEINDRITVDGKYGKVTDITLRSTRIRTPLNSFIVVPNKLMADSIVINHTQKGEYRVEVSIGIAYKESIADARTALMKVLEQTEGVLKKPAPDVIVSELADSSVNLLVRAWVNDPARELGIAPKLRENCKTALDDAGIEIPFPHLQLHIDGMKDEVATKLK